MNSEPEEFFDVVNKSDVVVACDTRRNIHRLGLRHRAVHVLVFNSDGLLFLQKRSLSKDCFPGRWDSSAAGHVDHNESYDACAVRELREELGLTLPQPPERLFKIAACAETGLEFVWVYRCQSDGPFSLSPEEIDCGRWIECQDLEEWMRTEPDQFASSLPLIWRIYRHSSSHF